MRTKNKIMNQIKIKLAARLLISAFILLPSAFLITGCVTGARLETGGPYAASATQAAQPELFVMDSAFDVAYAALDTVFKYEQANRAALWVVSPNIKHSLDKVRIEAQRVVLDYALARTGYLSVSIPENLDGLAVALAKLQGLNSAALAVIATKGNS
jgi:hypothetical protein